MYSGLVGTNDVGPSVVERALVWSMVLAAFGPYVGFGIRTEQAYVYAVAGLALILGKCGRGPLERAAPFLLAWLGYVAIALVGGIWPPANSAPWGPGSFVAGVDNAAYPLAVAFLSLVLVSGRGVGAALLKDAFVALIALMMVNTGASIASLTLGISWDQWWSSAADSTADRAATMGRLSGLVNQPAEAGMLYSAALLGLIYLGNRRPIVLLCIAPILLIGGILTVSKVFVLGGVPIALILWLRMRGFGVSVFSVSAAIVGIASSALASGAFTSWNGADHLRRIVEGERGIVGSLSANRFGETSTLAPAIDAVWEGPRWFGFGAAGLNRPYDNAWLEALVVAGIFGVFLIAIALGWAVVSIWQLPSGDEREVGLAFVALTLVGSIGFTVLTANRVATVVWLLMFLIAFSGGGSMHPIRELQRREERA